ncbi:MAG: long-chain fatty acid--CoA ligase, partial [Candidatus Margulisiibacteriota bacterium]
SVGILAQPSPDWLMADLAILTIGAVTVPFFPSDTKEHIKYKTEDSKVKLLFLFIPDAWERVEPLTNLFRVISKGFKPDHQKVAGFDEFIKIGAEKDAQQPSLYPILLMEVKENDLATIIYTSGSTGVPKGVELTHKNMVSQLNGARVRLPLDSKKDIAVTCLPLAHSFEHTIVYYYIASGISIYFNSDIKNLAMELKEVKPTLVALVPLVFEKIYANIKAKIEAGSALEKIIGNWAINVANRHNPEKDKKNFLFWLADILVFKKLRKAMGGRLRFVISGGAPLKADLNQFFINVGVPLYQGYGLTEASPILSANFPDNNMIGSVGKPFPEVTIKIDPYGEVLAKGPNIMTGYHNLPEETANMIDPEGWLHTGDLGFIDRYGYLYLTGRKKELFKSSGGKYITPVPIEQDLTSSPVIERAMIIGEGKSFVSVLLFPDHAYIKKWNKDPGQSDREFLESPQIRKKVDDLIESINKKLNDWEQIKEYRFVQKPISVESGELTPTMKIKRHVIMERYKNLIKEIYGEQ